VLSQIKRPFGSRRFAIVFDLFVDGRRGDVHDAVDERRSGRLSKLAVIPVCAIPGQHQRADVRRVDLVERRVARRLS